MTMKRLLLTSVLVSLFAVFAACGKGDDGTDGSAGDSGADSVPDDPQIGGSENEGEFDMNITIRIGSAEFSATLDDSATGRAFAKMLPVTFDMSELNGNEKYFYMRSELPTASYSPGTIHAGDLMLYGNDCIVLFYKTFSSGYSYTRIGRVDNPDGLAQAVGSGDVRVTFE